MNKIYFILFFLATSFQASIAQSYKAYERSAEEALETKNYSSALAYYRIILEETGHTSTGNYYKAAETARKFRIYNTAENYYQKVAMSEEGNQYPLTYYWLGMVRKSQGKYDAAIEAFNTYLSTNTAADSEYADKARKEINDCGWAKELMEEPDDFNLEHLDTTVNTGDTELSPRMIDGRLYYTSFNEKSTSAYAANSYAHLMMSENGEQGQLMDSEINNEQDQHVAHATFTEDGKRVYYNICKSLNSSEVHCEIYHRDMDASNNWGPAVRLPDNINTPDYTATQVSVGKDKKTDYEYLFFASDRPEGKGKLDIWCSIINADGTFSKPFNIENINTAENDITPYFHTSSQTLYFSSDGYQNMGGFDIYESKKRDGEWQSPVHLGYPVNSSYDDSYYSVSSDNDWGLLTSNRPGAICKDTSLECTSCNDIYKYKRSIEIKLLALTFNDITKNPLLGCAVQLIDLTEGETVPQVSAADNGTNYLLQPDREYKLIATKDKYSSDELTFDTKGITVSSAIEKRLFLRPEVDLIVLTYNRQDSSILNGCLVELSNITLNRPDSTQLIEDTNRYHFPLEVDMVYRVIASKLDYGEDGAEVSTKGISEPTTLTQKLYLDQQVDAYPILPLYFNNDYPDPKTMSVKSTQPYGETYANYINKKDEYKARFPGDADTQKAVDSFFEDEVKAGYERLLEFSEDLADYLAQDETNKVDVILKGYASPLAQSAYNFNLTKRRIDSMIRHFKTYKNGMLLPYFANGQLSVTEEPYGEERAAAGINDSPKSPNSSIYGVAASRERRVEIVEIYADETEDAQSKTSER